MSGLAGPQSREGFHWTEKEGLQQGLPSLGVVKPESNTQRPEHVYDVIIVGAGYAGLTAARDLATSGLSVLLLEARDRIGGRTWSSNIGGYPFEMGGTWVHWGQPHVFREITRYDMRRDLDLCPDYSKGINNFSLITPAKTRVISHDEEGELLEATFRKFANVDGNMGKTIMPFPHDPHFNPDVARYDGLTIIDRFNQIADDVTPTERMALEAFLLLCSGGKPENTGFFDALRWWALGFYSMDGIMQTCISYKFRPGQSLFARKFFQEALDSQKLSYAFNCTITAVADTDSLVEVSTQSDQKFQSRRMICTIPLNVLSTIRFSPPLEDLKREGISVGHVNQVAKVHAEVKTEALRSWSGLAYPDNRLTYGIGDGTTPAGNTHLVFFGADANHLDPEEDIQKTLKAVKAFGDMEVERLVFHNWSKDEFAKGAWCWFNAGVASKYIDALRARHGNVLFASADWALGWRGFIDGAIEEGTRAALAVRSELGPQAEAQSSSPKEGRVPSFAMAF